MEHTGVSVGMFVIILALGSGDPDEVTFESGRSKR